MLDDDDEDLVDPNGASGFNFTNLQAQYNKQANVDNIVFHKLTI